MTGHWRQLGISEPIWRLPSMAPRVMTGPTLPALGEVRCGAGPVITRFLRTPGLNGWTPNPKLASFIESVAGEIGVGTQRDAVQGLMTDAKPLRLGGIPSALIGIPMRGKHSPAEIVSIGDIEAAVRLVVELAQRIDRSLNISRG